MAAEAAAATAAVNPYLAGAQVAVGTATDIVGMILEYQAQQAAIREARKIDERNFREEQRRNRFAENISEENLAIDKSRHGIEKNRFKLDAMNQGAGVQKSMVDRVLGILNGNTALTDRVIKNWSM